jgi:hypothetical protein
MLELRIQSHGALLRVFYAFDPKRNAILLIGGNKRGQEKRFYSLAGKPAKARFNRKKQLMEA